MKFVLWMDGLGSANPLHLSPPESSGEREMYFSYVGKNEELCTSQGTLLPEFSLKIFSCGCIQEISLYSSCKGTLMPKNTDATWDN